MHRFNRALRMPATKLLEYFDEDVHDRLRLPADAQMQLDRVRQFWQLTQWAPVDGARFYNEELAFDLEKSPSPQIAEVVTIS